MRKDPSLQVSINSHFSAQTIQPKYEACPLFNEENKKLLLDVASTFENDAKAKGIKVLSMYHSGLEHTFEWIVESPGAHVIQDLMVETKVAKFNSTKIVPLRTTQNVVEYLTNQ